MKQLNGLKIGILGGDEREKVMIEYLIAAGARLKVLGDPGRNLSHKVEKVFTLKELIKDVQTVIAPMSGTDLSGGLKARFVEEPIYLDNDFFALIPKTVPVLIGNTSEKVKLVAKNAGVKLILIAKREDIGILNAIPTAEGTIQIAMEKLPITIHGSKSLILGLGKCGITLAWRLRALGSETFGVTRSPEAIAKAKDLGIHILSYENLMDYLHQFDLICNTVPALVLFEDRIKLMKPETLIIDLASAPGGTDFVAAEKYGIDALLALGLPGKVAPKTAGKILGKIIPQVITETLNSNLEV